MIDLNDEEYRFYNHEAVAELASDISVAATDTLKYIYSNYTNQTNPEDYKYFEDKLLRASFRLLRECCVEFINAYDHYNFCSTEPYPKDKEAIEVIVERTKAYQAYKEEHFTKIVAYDEYSDYYDLLEEE